MRRGSADQSLPRDAYVAATLSLSLRLLYSNQMEHRQPRQHNIPNPLHRSRTLIWTARGWRPGALALACALVGEQYVVTQQEQGALLATRWYTLGIVLAILAWAGTYTNKTGLTWPQHVAPAPSIPSANATRPARRLRGGWRWARRPSPGAQPVQH